MSLGPEIRDVVFTPVRLREGYDMGEVDAFLDDLAEAADHDESLRPMVDRARFTPVRLREGYDMGEVDTFLERVAGPAGAAVTSRPVTPSRDQSVVEERRGLISRLFRRGF